MEIVQNGMYACSFYSLGKYLYHFLCVFNWLLAFLALWGMISFALYIYNIFSKYIENKVFIGYLFGATLQRLFVQKTSSLLSLANEVLMSLKAEIELD